MKSFFTKLGKLLLCGVAVAVVGCTDYDTDIQNVNDRLDGLKQETTATAEDLAEAIAALEAKLATQYATKEYVDGLNKEVKDQLTKDVTALSGRIDAANKAIEDAVATVSTQLSALDDKKADKTALNEAVKAIEDLEKELNTVKTDLEGEIETVKTQIADAKAELNEKIAGVDAKANELQNTLVSLSEYLGGLEAKVNEINNTLLSLSEYLPKMKAELEAKISAVDAKAEENYNTLVSLSEHLTEYEATTDLKLTELHGSLAALSTYLETYEAEVDAKFTEIRNTLDSLSEYLKEKFGELDATDTDLYMEIDGLREVITSINNLLALETENREAADEALEAKIQELRNTLLSLEPVIASLQNEDNELWKQYNELQANVGQIYTSLTERINATDAALAAHKAAYETKVAEIEAKINELNNTLLSLSEYLPEMKAALEAKINELRSTLVSLEPVIDNLQNEDVQLQQQITDLQNNLAAALNVHADDVDAIYAALKENTEELAGQIQTTQNALSSALLYINMNSENIENLMSRVQSLVYVPDYDDHKAAISWAELYGQESEGILVKKSVLRYRVYANADEDAVAAAKAIATTWTPETFYYEVEPVKRAWTRSATVPASLEITKVEAKGEYLEVEVLAKNFNPDFFYAYWYGNNQPRMEIKPEEGNPADEKNSYSVSLVLSDGNNNRSTEYTNLVPAYPEFIQAVVLDGEDKDITFRSYEDAPVEYLPYDRDPAERTILKGHRLAFIAGEEINTADDLIAAGYDIQLERSVYQKVLGSDEYQHHLITLKKGEAEKRQVGKFELREDPLTSITAENDTYVKIREEMSKETYKALKAKNEHILTIDYIYNINGVTVNTQASAEICNRLVEVEFNVDVPWTFETALSTKPADGKVYEGNLNVTDFAYDLSTAVKNNKSLEGYSLKTIIEEAAATGTKSNGGHYDIALKQITAETFNVRLQSGSTKYAFPVNNNDDVKDVNTYSTTWKTDFEDLTISVKVNMHLGEQAPVQKNEKDVTFTPGLGASGWLFGYWNALEDAFNNFKSQGYITEASKDAFIAAFADAEYATPLVNGENGIAQNTNVAFAAGEHKFQLWHEQIEEVYVDGTQHTIQQDATPYFGIDFEFYVNGKVDLGDYALDLDPVRVVDNIVDVEGEIVGGVYTVDVSDLAKYYYVVNESGTKALEAVNEGDVLTVDFALSAMEGAEVDGFNFNNVADQTEYSLNVDWTSTTPYILPMSEAIAMWGTYPHTEVEVDAVLKVNGFPVASKPITLVTKDPLTITLKDLEVEVVNKPGTNDEPTVAKVYKNFELYSAVEPEAGNLFNNDAKTINGVFYFSKANVTYGATMSLKKLRVYYKDANGVAHDWDESKLTFGGLDEDGYFDGNISIKADDGNIKTPIYVDVRVKMSHKIHDAAKTTCETEGDVTVTFLPAGYVAE